MPTVTNPPILDSTGQAIAAALANISIRPQIIDSLISTATNKALSANMGKTLNDKIVGMTPSIVVSASSFNEFVNSVVTQYLSRGRTKLTAIAEWPNHDFYAFEMVVLDSSHAFGTIYNIFNSMEYKNYNFSYNAGTLTVHNILCKESNSNGNVLMINDSVQICWGTATYSITEWYQWGNAFEAYPGINIPFPRSFSGAPVAFLSGCTSANAGTGVEYGSTNASHIIGCYVLRPATGTVPATAYIDWVAIGTPS